MSSSDISVIFKEALDQISPSDTYITIIRLLILFL